jgi:hypothetical protein
MKRRTFIAGLGRAAAWAVMAGARRFPVPRTAHLIVVLGFLCTGIAIDGAAGAALNIVALGASNTPGWGVGSEQAYPARLEAMLRAKGYDAHVANAGMSFDTTGGMLRRVDSAVPRLAEIETEYVAGKVESADLSPAVVENLVGPHASADNLVEIVGGLVSGRVRPRHGSGRGAAHGLHLAVKFAACAGEDELAVYCGPVLRHPAEPLPGRRGQSIPSTSAASCGQSLLDRLGSIKKRP